MRRMMTWQMVLIVCVLCSCVVGAFAQDWPQWRGTNRDGKAAGFSVPETWPQALTQSWRVHLGGTDATPALVGDKLYVYSREDDQETVSCLNAADGSVIWQDKVTAPAIGGPAARQHPGPRATPAVAEGRVVTVGIVGVISCLDAETGALLWRKDPFPGVTPAFFASASPLIADGLAIAFLGGPGNGALIAFDLATGDEKWRWAAEGPDYGSPVLMTAGGVKQVVTLTEKSVVGVSLADGALLWQIPFATARMAYNAATPIIDGQTVIYSGRARGTTAVRVEKQGDAFAASQLWTNSEIGVQFSTPVLQDGFLYGLSDKGNLFCLSAEDGRTMWSDETQRDRGSFGPMVAAGTAIFCLPSSGQLIAFRAEPEGFTPLTEYKVAEAPVFGHPVLSGSRVFVQDQAGVTLWTLP